VYHGSLNGSRVCIKRVRGYSSDDPEKAAKVRSRRNHLPCPPSLTKPADLLQGGRDVETLETPEHHTPTWRHHQSLPTHFGVDAKRGPARLHREEPERRSTRAREQPRSYVYPTLTLITSCLTSLRGSPTSTSATWFMGTSRVCVVVLNRALLY